MPKSLQGINTSHRIGLNARRTRVNSKKVLGGAKPSKRPRKAKWPKFNKSDLQRADTAFSKKIIARDKRCQYPGCEVSDPAKLTCSHYYGRAIKNTRFDEDNCIALCRTHHYWDKQLGYEFQKQTQEKHGWNGRYTLHMIRELSDERWFALKTRSEAPFDRELYARNLLPFKKNLTN